MYVFINLSHPNPPVFNFLRFERICNKLLRLANINQELSILLVDNTQIKSINNEWFNKNKSTNVISFYHGKNDLLGDIVISLDTALYEAQNANIPFDIRLEELLIHGFTHLMGFDHETEEQIIEMQEKEKKFKYNLNKERIMADLCINIDHIATLRQARKDTQPDPVYAASIVELAGADGIVVHLREDRRHINDRDVRILRETVKTRLNLEMAATEEMLIIAGKIKPDIVTLVPEKRQELTTEGGLDVISNKEQIQNAIKTLNKKKIPVSLFIDPNQKQIEMSKEVGAHCIEIHTGLYAYAFATENEDEEFEKIMEIAAIGKNLGLKVHAGHGLDYRNTQRVSAISDIDEFSIGYAIIARSVFTGLERAVREMLSIVKKGVII